jgi:hypothetical protein
VREQGTDCDFADGMNDSSGEGVDVGHGGLFLR